MLFSSLTFLFIFLPLICLLYFLVKKRMYKNIVLLMFSLVFYAWGEPKYIFLMILTILTSYIFGLLIHKFDKEKKPKAKKITFILSVIVILSSLIFFKYTHFIFDNINSVFGSNIVIDNIILPIGISFYTFQILSYVIDLYRNKIKVQKNICNLALYVTLFPQLIAGPIVRYETIEDELDNRKETFEGFSNGLKRFIMGLGKKVIISNNVAILADFVFDNALTYNNEMGTALIWLGAIAYSLQIYYDFSGYSDMAIGLGEMFGFHFLENFNYPYISKSITDFWRRWHISLSSWFRDYIYIPLGGNRVKKLRHIFNIFVVWALTGLWHGAAWNFIIWGLYFGIILIIEKFLLGKLLNKLPKLVQWIYAIIFIVIGWVIFRANNLAEIGYIIKKLFDFSSTDFIALLSINNFSLSLIYMVIGIIIMFPIYPKIKEKLGDKTWYQWLEVFFCIGILLLCILFLVSSSYNPFIYFRF
ncbi:MAG: MBOAT family O-acyltransferase [Candidatus Coprovivens sp.]